jgi:hypothetical protein
MVKMCLICELYYPYSKLKLVKFTHGDTCVNVYIVYQNLFGRLKRYKC